MPESVSSRLTRSEPLAVIDWLLDSDPSIRWQVMRDLTRAPAEAVAAERARVATEGWGARLLALQDADGQWGKDALPAAVETAGEGLPDVATRKLLRELHSIPLEDIAGFLELDMATLSNWENEPDPQGEHLNKYHLRFELDEKLDRHFETRMDLDDLVLYRSCAIWVSTLRVKRLAEQWSWFGTTANGTMTARTTSTAK